ncbi:GNAT family N-acetyltransferase [Paenibacillus nasutitermitis]|uniref:N-acetyltransferase domain-containing protein n=1 Tax=Paenibacillus nasutitermitis TaxID=1652958 RepID=A0A916YVC5_9BACL|nr:GNAT family N-acetyltransferase [Paenibacillus nasutitermitis]GGD62068.1 hypothetical protein GCM10010911_19940 [Paenibacillus nasutitermitis]
MIFRTIDIKRDRDTIVAFRKDSYVVSYGSDEGFGDEEEYVIRIRDRVNRFPEGLVLVEYNDITIGQIELQILNYEETDIGYVNLFYLMPGYRGKGYGDRLLEYAENFFRNHHVREYHLRVSPSNHVAVKFYEKHGLKKLKEEKQNYITWRMAKELN